MAAWGPEGVFQTLTLNGPFGPAASVSLNAASIVASDVTGYSGLIANVSAAVNTPFGPIEWFSFSGSHLATATGQFATSLSQSGPLGPEGIAVNGSLPFGITGGSISTTGLQFWFEGTPFGVTPLFLQRFGIG